MSIEHPSMKKAKSISKTPVAGTKNYVVDSPAESEQQEFINPIPSELLGVPVASESVEQEVKLEPKKVSMFEQLVFLGRASKEVEIGGIKFTLETLTHRDNTALIKRIYGLGEASDLFTIRSLTLSYALTEINGQRVEEIELDGIEMPDDATAIDRRNALLNSMQRFVVEKLHDEYSKMVDEAEASLSSPEDREQLKK